MPSRLGRWPLLIMTSLAMVLIAAPASAHPRQGEPTFYPQKYSFWTPRAAVFWDDSFRNAPVNAMARSLDAMEVWNSVGRTFQMEVDPARVDVPFMAACDPWTDPQIRRRNSNTSALHWFNLGNQNYLAVTMSCGEQFVTTADFDVFHIAFNSAVQNWRMDNGTNPQGGVVDFYATAVHEFGHATGFGPAGFPTEDPGHYAIDDPVCDGSLAHHTMCGGSVSPVEWIRLRTLQLHDRETFSSYYAALNPPDLPRIGEPFWMSGTTPPLGFFRSDDAGGITASGLTPGALYSLQIGGVANYDTSAQDTTTDPPEPFRLFDAECSIDTTGATQPSHVWVPNRFTGSGGIDSLDVVLEQTDPLGSSQTTFLNWAPSSIAMNSGGTNVTNFDPACSPAHTYTTTFVPIGSTARLKVMDSTYANNLGRFAIRLSRVG